MPFEPLDGRRSPAPQGTALLGVGDDASSAGVDEFFARLRRGLTEPLPGASPMSSGKLMVDPNRAAAVPMALADMVKRVVMDAAGGWSDAYDMAAAGAEPHEYGPEVFKAAGVATAGGYPRAGIGLGSAGGRLPNPAGLLTWAKQQPEFELMADKYFRQLQVQQAKEVGPAANTFMESANLGKDPGALWRNTQDADKVVRLVKATKQSDLGDAAERMAAEALWMRTIGGPELGSAGGRLSAPGPAAEQAMAADQVVSLLNEMGAKGVRVRKGNSKSDPTLYVDFERGDHRAMPTTIRIPKPGHRDHGVAGQEKEIGRLFDMTRSPTADPRFAENASMGPLADIDNLREVVKWRLSKSPDGQWLVSPDHAPAATRRVPGEQRPTPPPEGADFSPDQLRLLSGGVPVASLSEAPEKPPPHSKIPASRWWERMEPDSPSSKPRRESPPIRPINPRRIRIAGVDDDQWEAFESMSAFARSLDPGFTSIPEDGETAREQLPAPAARMNLGMGVPRPEQAGVPPVQPATFGGERSKTANNATLAEAKELHGKSDPKEIWETTGWFRGADGKWRSEIDDSGLKVLVRPEAISVPAGKGYQLYKLSDLIEHDDLFKAYPYLKDMRVSVYDGKPNGPGGAYSFADGIIAINKNVATNPAIFRDTMLHEIQHALQAKEGFSYLGNPLNALFGDGYSIPGEIEARDIVNRNYMGKAWRKKHPPSVRPDNVVDPRRDRAR